jgi:HEAT repeat protein
MRHRPLALLLVLGLAACGSAPSKASTGTSRGRAASPVPAGPRPSAADVADTRPVDVSKLSREDLREFQGAWRLFVTHDPSWEDARERWLERGGAAPFLLSENLFRYFWSASRYGKTDEVWRVGENARRVGEPAVAYFAKALVTDKWPLKEPVTIEVFNPDNIAKPLTKTFTHYDMDDQTRQDAARVLATIGESSVPLLTSATVRQSSLRSARVYGSYALGAIGSDAAIAALARTLDEEPEWQVRGAAAKALGFALSRNPKAKAPLEQALQDSDRFVREKAKEALEGKTRLEF